MATFTRLSLLVVSFYLALQSTASSHQHDRRLVNLSALNSTNLQACKALSPQSKVYYPLSQQYGDTTSRYMATSMQNPACVFVPTTPSELSSAIKLIGQKRIQFAVSSGKHASNQGFSSTTGIHISMKGFQQVVLSSKRDYVDVGTGNVWDNVYQVLNGECRPSECFDYPPSQC